VPPTETVENSNSAPRKSCRRAPAAAPVDFRAQRCGAFKGAGAVRDRTAARGVPLPLGPMPAAGEHEETCAHAPCHAGFAAGRRNSILPPSPAPRDRRRHRKDLSHENIGELEHC
jgi:hypothetical protein